MPAGVCVSLSKIITPSADSSPSSPRIEPSDAFTTSPPSSSGWAFSICASKSTTCAPIAAFTPVPQNSAGNGGGILRHGREGRDGRASGAFAGADGKGPPGRAWRAGGEGIGRFDSRRTRTGVGAGGDDLGQRNTNACGHVDRGAGGTPQMEAQRGLFFAGDRRSDAHECEPYADALVGAAHGRFR